MKTAQEKQQVGGILGFIERVGNKIPDITILFVGAFVLVCVISAILSQMHFDYVHPTTGKNIVVNNMLSGENIVLLLSKMVTNYAGFPPLGMVIVATLGIGIADGSGYINTGLKKLLAVTPKFLLTPIIILAGMISHIGPDTGYVIIIPVAAYMFYATGKHPLAGIAASFAGIAGAFAANYTPSAIDPVIQGFTQSAARLIDPTYEVNVLCNYFFAFASTFGVIAACWYVTEKISELAKKYEEKAEISVNGGMMDSMSMLTGSGITVNVYGENLEDIAKTAEEIGSMIESVEGIAYVSSGYFQFDDPDFREEAEAYWGLVLCKYGIEYVDDPATGKKIPTCHRSSFDSIMDDTDFEQALENAKGTALQDMAGAFEILDEEGGNPMSHGARVTLISMEKFDQTVESIKKVTGVHSVVSHGDLAKTIADIKSGISMICFWIIGILGVIALVIVSNTIRVTMYNRKLEISIMKAVGATNKFIRFPFVIEGMIIGVIGALIPLAAVYVIYNQAMLYVAERFAYLSQLMQFLEAKTVFANLTPVCLGMGVGIGFIGSFTTVRKHLSV